MAFAVDSREHWVEVPGDILFAREWCPDTPHGAPVVLLHDSLGSVAQWREFPEALAAATGRAVIAYDRLGFGASSQRTEQLTVGFIDDEAEVYLPALVRALGLDAHVLFGHSVGGGMALAAAAQDGSCVAVITEAAQAFVEERTLAGIRAAREGFRDAAQFSRLEKWHGDKAGWVLDAWTEVWLSSAFRDWSLDPYLNRVHCPVLAIHGGVDEYGSEAFPRRITQGVSGPARMELLAGCGHVPHRERQSDVLALVQGFLEGHAVP